MSIISEFIISEIRTVILGRGKLWLEYENEFVGFGFYKFQNP